MTAAALITLRETLEASLVVGIVLAYLQRLELSRHDVYVWSDVAMGVVSSIVTAILFSLLLGGFTGRAGEVYEGVVMLLLLFAATLAAKAWRSSWGLSREGGSFPLGQW